MESVLSNLEVTEGGKADDTKGVELGGDNVQLDSPEQLRIETTTVEVVPIRAVELGSTDV